MKRTINGIQQVGIGVANAQEAFDWYRKFFGADVIVFRDSAPASLMKKYTGNEEHHRLALLAMNMQSGGGFEIWQYTSRNPQFPQRPPQLGDLGIFAVKIKCKDVQKTYELYKAKGVTVLTSPAKSPDGKEHFFVKDPYGNIFEIVKNDYWFCNTQYLTGGVCGVVTGVTDINRSVSFYRNVLGYDEVISNASGVFEDIKQLNGGAHAFKRVLLGHGRKISGAFGKLLGPTYIELVEVQDRKPQKIYADRYWGDPGFMHVCYDINGMDVHEKICMAQGQPLTVNSKNSFEMGDAAGHFCYNEDPDGSLIEYVETHKVPVVKKIGWYLNLKNRNPQKPLPDWIVRCLGFSRVKD
jgi:catechol 2,3-dioxygenase-like lactoylglutathione lyase family enzyme